MTTAGPPEVSAALSALVETCRDGELSFHAAAAGIVDPLLRQLCESYAEQRAGFRRELVCEFARLGLEPAAARVAGGDTWSAAPNESATLAELARREAAAEATYRETLRRGIPGPTTETVERQHLLVRDALKHLGQLERAFAGQT